MVRYRISHSTKYSYSAPVPVCHNQVHLAPRSLPHQTCEEFRLLVNPAPAQRGKRLDYFGNQVDYFAIHEAHLGLSVSASSVLNVAPRQIPAVGSGPNWEALRGRLRSERTTQILDAFQFAFTSHDVPLSDEFADYARESFKPGRKMLEAATELTSRIHRDFTYDPRATTVSTPVTEVFQRRKGVCQDFAHFQIASLRSLGLAARYVSGYLRTLPPAGKPRLVGADASHAWVSVFCGELGWVDFDPTNDVLPDLNHVTVAWGRDYHDVCPIQGVFVGGGEHSLAISVDVQALDAVAPAVT